MELSEYIDKNLLEVDFKAKGKEEALRAMAKAARASGKTGTLDEETIFRALSEREDMGTTGFGDGIAIPHARLQGLDDFVVMILVSRKGVPFDALDNKKVSVFCLILAPADKVNEHLRILASCSRLLSLPQFKRAVVASRSADILYETLIRYSGDAAPVAPGKKMKLMIIILYYDDYLYNILEFLIENEIKGATIIESGGMGAYISSIPIFASFLGFMREDKNKSKTIMCLVPEDAETKLAQGIEAITGDLDKKQGAMLMTLSLSLHKGTMEII